MTDLFQSPALSRRDTIWADGPKYLIGHGMSEKEARALIGRWMGRYDHGSIRQILSRCMNARNGPVDPRSYINKALEEDRKRAAPDLAELSDAALAAKIKHMTEFARTRPASPQAHKLLADLRAEAAKRERMGNDIRKNRRIGPTIDEKAASPIYAQGYQRQVPRMHL